MTRLMCMSLAEAPDLHSSSSAASSCSLIRRLVIAAREAIRHVCHGESFADGERRGIRVPRLVVGRTDHAPRASTTTNRAKRPESVRRGAVVRRTPGSEEVSVCDGWSLNGRTMLLERPQRPAVRSVLRACGGVLSCVEHQGAKRRARRRCARSGIMVGRTEWRVDSIPSRGTHMQSHEGNVVRAARGPKLWLLHSACARLLSFPGPMLMEIEEGSVCHGWSLNGRTMLLERPQRPAVRSVLRVRSGGLVVCRTPGSEEACSSALRTVWNCGCSNRVESRFNSIPWHTYSAA